MTREMRKQSENNFQPDSDRQRKTNVNMAEGKCLVNIVCVFYFDECPGSGPG